MTLEEAEHYVEAYAVVVRGFPDDVLSATERAANPEARFAIKAYVSVRGDGERTAAAFAVSPVTWAEIPEEARKLLRRQTLKALAMLLEREA